MSPTILPIIFKCAERDCPHDFQAPFEMPTEFISLMRIRNDRQKCVRLKNDFSNRRCDCFDET